MEKLFYSNCLTATTYSLKADISGIVKRVRLCLHGASNVADGSSGTIIFMIHPVVDTVAADYKTKFSMHSELVLDENPSGRHFATKTWVFPTNFFLDKTDYIIFRQALGNTLPFLAYLDIVPVSDKFKLLNSNLRDE